MWIDIKEEVFALNEHRPPYEHRVGDYAIVAIGRSGYKMKQYTVWTVRELFVHINERQPALTQHLGNDWAKALEVFNEQIRIVSAELAVRALDLNNEQA